MSDRKYRLLTCAKVYPGTSADGRLIGEPETLHKGALVQVVRTERWTNAMICYDDGQRSLYGWVSADEIDLLIG